MTSTEDAGATATVRDLLSAAAVRDRAHRLLAVARADRLAHFTVRESNLPAAADYVVETIRRNYPALDVPFHARWRHFVVDGTDHWQALVRSGALPADRTALARARFELAITSVLLDAGAGPHWRWRVPAAKGAADFAVGRSEGLALASLAAFGSGLFSSQRGSPLCADARGLQAVTAARLGAAFQVSSDNPLAGLEGRAHLLNRLGEVVERRADLFGDAGRLGGLFDTLLARSTDGSVAAPSILALVLEALGPIWPGRIVHEGIALGDTWRHPAIDVAGPTRGLIPFHKLSQWLSYSLIEPLQEYGVVVNQIDGLTGLAEYRNGGLFLDLGVIVPRAPEILTGVWQPADEPIVEWRALTVALLDAIAPLVRARLGKTADAMPLAAILEGGTWSAGRRIAAERRQGAGPPLTIASDGSVF